MDPKLCANPRGYQEVPLFQNRNPYIKAVAPLFNSGKLSAIDIHRYWDVQYVPMSHGFDFSLQHQFDQVKKQAGITADVQFCTTEMNFKKRVVDEEAAAAGFLTALWDALTVVRRNGNRVTQFARAVRAELRDAQTLFISSESGNGLDGRGNSSGRRTRGLIGALRDVIKHC